MTTDDGAILIVLIFGGVFCGVWWLCYYLDNCGKDDWWR